MAVPEGIVVPKAEFIDDVAAYMEGKTTDSVIQEHNDRYRKFKLIESQFMQKRARLLTKLPEIQKALEIVKKLSKTSQEGQDLLLDFELAEGFFAKAKVPQAETVNLWLGASIMVEYPLSEAEELLETNLETCKANLITVTQDLEALKDNITTTEVSIARVYNYDVERRRKLKEQGQAS